MDIRSTFISVIVPVVVALILWVLEHSIPSGTKLKSLRIFVTGCALGAFVVGLLMTVAQGQPSQTQNDVSALLVEILLTERAINRIPPTLPPPTTLGATSAPTPDMTSTTLAERTAVAARVEQIMLTVTAQNSP